MRHRRGSTLIELVMSMIAGSGVMLLGISLVHQSMLLSELSGRRADSNRKLDQLTQRFRRDVHAATQWTFDANSDLALTCSDGSQIKYAVKEQVVTREHKNGTEDSERDRFVLAEDASVSIEPMAEPTRISLVVRNASRHVGNETTGSRGRLDLTVECVPGRWQILERSGVQP